MKLLQICVLFSISLLQVSHCEKNPSKCVGKTTCTPLADCFPYFDAVNQENNEGREYAKRKLVTLVCGFEGTSTMVCCPDEVPNEEVTSPPVDITGHPNLKLLPVSCKDTGVKKQAELPDKNWMAVLLQQVPSDDYAYFCGGSIINERYILTAAHCVDLKEKTLNKLKVRVGISNLQKYRCISSEEYCEDEKYQDLGIEKIIIHPQYNWANRRNDIAIVRLDERIDMKEYSEPACLPTTKELLNAKLEGSNITISGWGITELGWYSPDLQISDLSVMENGDCRKFYKKIYNINFKQLCTKSGKDKQLCNGDCGGPLFLKKGTKYIQYGVMSSGSNECVTQPGVFARVPYYMKWILDELKP